MNWTHNGLANDLAAHLRASTDRMVWADMQLGPAGSPRPDVFTLPKSYAKFQPMVYEVKISVADFRRDVTAGKWHSYRDFACGIVFAVPKGLISKGDLPKGCGLMTRSEAGWHTAKAPTLSPVDTLPHEVWMKLLIDGACRLGREARHKFFLENVAQKKIGQRYGSEVAQLLANRDNMIGALQDAVYRHESNLRNARSSHEDQMERLRKELSRDKQTIDEERVKLCQALGLPATASAWEIANTLRKVREHITADAEVERVRDHLANVRKALHRAIETLDSQSPLERAARGEEAA